MSGLPTRTLYVYFGKMYQGQIRFFVVRNKPNLSKGVLKCFWIQINDKNPEEGGRGGGVQSHPLFRFCFLILTKASVTKFMK